eukprot:gene4091-18748_t
MDFDFRLFSVDCDIRGNRGFAVTEELLSGCGGAYDPVPGRAVNGYPLWRKRGARGAAARLLYSTPRGKWRVTADAPHFLSGRGLFSSAEAHRGLPPCAVREWRQLPSKEVDPRAAVLPLLPLPPPPPDLAGRDVYVRIGDRSEEIADTLPSEVRDLEEPQLPQFCVARVENADQHSMTVTWSGCPGINAQAVIQMPSAPAGDKEFAMYALPEASPQWDALHKGDGVSIDGLDAHCA